jgi:multicomponent Na+:H+ antiporter subunit F
VIALVLALIRLFIGPSLYDRVLALNVVGTKTVLLIGVVGFLTERPDWLDISLLYALINFIGTLAVLKFFRYRGSATGRPWSRRNNMILHVVAEVASWLFILAGSAGIVISTLGLVRLPDFYTRLHAGGVTDTMGAC